VASGEADERLHGTVKEVVSERFKKEREALQPLPEGGIAQWDVTAT